MEPGQKIAELKKDPQFPRKVGMILVHNGVVRQWSRNDGIEVQQLEVHVDHERIEEIISYSESRPGIFRVSVEAREGLFVPGDDLMLVLVAGDIRENVFPVLEETVNRIKKEALSKREVVD